MLSGERQDCRNTGKVIVLLFLAAVKRERTLGERHTIALRSRITYNYIVVLRDRQILMSVNLTTCLRSHDIGLAFAYNSQDISLHCHYVGIRRGIGDRSAAGSSCRQYYRATGRQQAIEVLVPDDGLFEQFCDSKEFGITHLVILCITGLVRRDIDCADSLCQESCVGDNLYYLGVVRSEGNPPAAGRRGDIGNRCIRVLLLRIHSIAGSY